MIIYLAKSTYEHHVNLSKTNLFVRVTIVTATLDGIEILVIIPLIFSLSNYAGDLHRIVMESGFHLGQPLLRNLPPNQCLHPQFYELTQLLVRLVIG